MKSKTILLFVGLALVAGSAQAFNMGNMMNPSRWFNDNDHDRYYGGGYGPYGWGGPYGGYGPYGGWGGPYGGYGPYGWGGGYPPAIVVNPGQGSATLRRRPDHPSDRPIRSDSESTGR